MAMPLDTHAAFNSILSKADTLVEAAQKRASNVTVKKAAPIDELTQRVEETQLEAQVALQKLAQERKVKEAKRSDKVALAQHIALTAAKLLEG